TSLHAVRSIGTRILRRQLRRHRFLGRFPRNDLLQRTRMRKEPHEVHIARNSADEEQGNENFFAQRCLRKASGNQRRYRRSQNSFHHPHDNGNRNSQHRRAPQHHYHRPGADDDSRGEPRQVARNRQQKHYAKRSEEHTSELQSRFDLVCRLLLEKKKKRSPLCSLTTESDVSPFLSTLLVRPSRPP